MISDGCECFIALKIRFVLMSALCRLPSAQSHRYGLNSLSFRGSLLWNALEDELKRAETLRSFKRGSKNGMAMPVNV